MPARISDAAKTLRNGTAKRDVPRGPLGLLTNPPRPPVHLSTGAAAEWRRLARELVSSGVLTSADLTALALLCEALALEADMRAIVAAEGATVAAGGGGRKSHPAAKIATEARAQAIRLLEAFGLTPASRQRVDATPPIVSSPRDPWARLLALQGGKHSG